MKNLLFSFVLMLGLASLQATDFKTSVTARTNSKATLACKYGQCNATAKSTGNRCLHCVSKSGDLYCWQHK